ncbi:MAG TPA: glycosyltransferase family 2 protein [Thiobacillaceae bacterium]|nr:glycosyltransferase family 2 protein [Thiobacillaceae bacterium]HNU63919.1 glycosyltransferase family 2 protein [Thiobacillaceae bacterium]
MKNGLTIGVPVHNEEARIERTLRSVVGQCETLIISDNASTDGTGKICEDLAREYDHVIYFRHPRNIGAARNWVHILQNISTPYFMFVGAHDHIESSYASALLSELDKDPTAVGAFGQLYFDDGERIIEQRAFNGLRTWESDSVRTRILGTLYSGAPVQWAVYGLLRTEACRQRLIDAIGQGPSYGSDVLFLIRILRDGKIRIASTVRFYGWIRKNDSTDALAKRCDPDQAIRSRKLVKNEYLAAQHQAMLESLGLQDTWPGFMIKLRSYAHFGPFRSNRLDVLYFLAYIPARLIHKTSKLLRKWKRGLGQ